MSATAVIYNIQRMSTQDGPGLRTTVFFKGCPLKCLWCSNPESQAPRPQLMHFANLCTGCGRCLDVCPSGAVRRENSLFVRDFSRCAGCGRCAEVCPSGAASMSGREMTVDDIMRAVRRDASFYFNSGGGVTFSGGECTMQGAFLADLLDACLAEGLHTCVDTCGQTPAGVFERVLERADLLLYDIKHMDSAEHRKLTGAGCETIQKNLRLALAECPEKLRIRVPLMPGMNDTEENIRAMAGLLLPHHVRRVDVLPCHFFGRNKYQALNLPEPAVREYAPEELGAALKRFADAGLQTEIVS